MGISDIPANNPLPLVKHTPGLGDAHEKCDQVKFMILCPTDPKHHKVLAKYSCYRPACPVCWPSWAARAAKDAAARIEGYRDAHGTKHRPRHITFSPPPGTITDLGDLLDQTNRVMRLVGVEAAAAIPHPYRLVGGMDDGGEDLVSRANRYREALDSPDWRKKVYFSPHIHALVYGPLPPSDEFEKITGGWVYRNHEKESGTRGRLGGELEATIYYLLTHAWVLGNNAVVRYWFGMSTRKLGKLPGEPYFEIEKCKVCGTDCVMVPPDIVRFDGTVVHAYQDLHNAPPAIRKIKTWEFVVRVTVRRSGSTRSRSIWGPGGSPFDQGERCEGLL